MKKTFEKIADLLIIGSVFIGGIVIVIKIILQAN